MSSSRDSAPQSPNEEAPLLVDAKHEGCDDVSDGDDPRSRSSSSDGGDSSAADEDNGVRSCWRYMSPASRRRYPGTARSDYVTDVQAILAQRNLAFQSGSEVLVAWKPSWIPIENVPEGPLLISFRDVPKVSGQSSVGNLILPVEPNTALADDVAAAAAWRDREVQQYREHFQERSGGVRLQKRERGTPRQDALGSEAKRVPEPIDSEHKPQEQ
jgi:hypothetical protein